MMRRPTFTEGLLVALGLAVAGAGAAAALESLIAPTMSLRLLITGLAGLYGAWLLCRSPEQSGRVVVVCLWLATTALAWSWLALVPFLLLQTAWLWLIRALYHHVRPLSALLDVALSGAAVAGGLWAYGTGSLWLAIWSFFLVQALFPWTAVAALPEAPACGVTDHGYRDAREAARRALDRLTAG